MRFNTFFTIVSSPPRRTTRTCVVDVTINARCMVLTLMFDAVVCNWRETKKHKYFFLFSDFYGSYLHIHETFVALTFRFHVTHS